MSLESLASFSIFALPIFFSNDSLDQRLKHQETVDEVSCTVWGASLPLQGDLLFNRYVIGMEWSNFKLQHMAVAQHFWTPIAQHDRFWGSLGPLCYSNPWSKLPYFWHWLTLLEWNISFLIACGCFLLRIIYIWWPPCPAQVSQTHILCEEDKPWCGVCI